MKRVRHVISGTLLSPYWVTERDKLGFLGKNDEKLSPVKSDPYAARSADEISAHLYFCWTPEL